MRRPPKPRAADQAAARKLAAEIAPLLTRHRLFAPPRLEETALLIATDILREWRKGRAGFLDRVTAAWFESPSRYPISILYDEMDDIASLLRTFPFQASSQKGGGKA